MSSISSGTTSTTTLVHSGDTTGSLVFKTNDTGSGGTTAMTIDTSQNVGIGVTPSAWDITVRKGLQLGLGGVYESDTRSTYLGNTSIGGNYYYNSGWKYISTNYATRINFQNDSGNQGIITFERATSGTAGNAITFNEAMRIDSSGNLLINTTSNVSSARVNIAQGSSDGVMYQMMQFTGGSGTGGNEVGEMKRQTTANVANSATTILASMTFGELITVTGAGSGAIFADLLMASYNTVAVISSNTQQGGPASRTYSVSGGALRLTMGSATAMNITVQSLISGARGA